MNKPVDLQRTVLGAKESIRAGAMPDVQGSRDLRNLPIDRVGVRGIRYPMMVQGQDAEPQPSVGEFSLSVGLPADQKGTHMSRFVALLETMSRRGVVLDANSLAELSMEMLAMLEATEGSIEVRTPYFIRKLAPVSKVESLMDYELGFESHRASGVDERVLEVGVPVKSLCPCSKEISDYGAHNQRSMVRVRAYIAPGAKVSPTDLIRTVESQASCELWGLLKRPDEKYVTERAYENAKFVEDLVRDVALHVRKIPGVERASIEAENFESIHNHSAWARINA